MYDPSTLFIPLPRRGRNVKRTMDFVSGTRTRLDRPTTTLWTICLRDNITAYTNLICR